MKGDEFSRLALALEGTGEGAHMGHSDFRVGGPIFASLSADERVGTVKLTPDEQDEFVREHGAAFEPSAGAWALLLAWQRQAAAPPRKASAHRARASTRSSKA